MNTVIIEINAKPDQVFSWLDNPSKLSQWLPNIVENEVIQETSNRVGSTWRQVYDQNGRRMEMFGTTTVWEKNKRLGCEIRGQMFDLDVDYQLEDLDGRTRLTQVSQVRMKGIFKLMGLIMTPFMKKAQGKQTDDSFLKLTRLVEAEAKSLKNN